MSIESPVAKEKDVVQNNAVNRRKNERNEEQESLLSIFQINRIDTLMRRSQLKCCELSEIFWIFYNISLKSSL